MKTIATMEDARRLALARGAELEVGGQRFNSQRTRLTPTPASAPAAPAPAAPAAVVSPADLEAALQRMANAITRAVRPLPEPPESPEPPPVVVIQPAPAPRPKLPAEATMKLETNRSGLLKSGSMPLGEGRVLRFEVKRDPYTQRGTSVAFTIGDKA